MAIIATREHGMHERLVDEAAALVVALEPRLRPGDARATVMFDRAVERFMRRFWVWRAIEQEQSR